MSRANANSIASDQTMKSFVHNPLPINIYFCPLLQNASLNYHARRLLELLFRLPASGSGSRRLAYPSPARRLPVRQTLQGFLRRWQENCCRTKAGTHPQGRPGNLAILCGSLSPDPPVTKQNYPASRARATLLKQPCRQASFICLCGRTALLFFIGIVQAGPGWVLFIMPEQLHPKVKERRVEKSKEKLE